MGFAWVHTSEPARQHSPFACGRDVDGVAFAVGAVWAVGAAQRAIKFGFLTFSLKSGKLVGGGGRPGRGGPGEANVTFRHRHFRSIHGKCQDMT